MVSFYFLMHSEVPSLEIPIPLSATEKRYVHVGAPHSIRFCFDLDFFSVAGKASKVTKTSPLSESVQNLIALASRFCRICWTLCGSPRTWDLPIYD